MHTCECVQQVPVRTHVEGANAYVTLFSDIINRLQVELEDSSLTEHGCSQNMFVMCVAYYLMYLPVAFLVPLRSAGSRLSEEVQFAVEWIYHSSAAVNGILYIALHSSVRRELRRYLPCRRRNAVAPATVQPVGDGGRRRHLGIVRDAGAPGAPANMMTSSCQRDAERLPTTVL